MSATHPPYRQDPLHCEHCDMDVMPIHYDQALGDLLPCCPDCGRRVYPTDNNDT